MLTLPVPVAAMLAVCHLAVALALALSGTLWIAAFVAVSGATAALFLRRHHVEYGGA